MICNVCNFTGFVINPKLIIECETENIINSKKGNFYLFDRISCPKCKGVVEIDWLEDIFGSKERIIKLTDCKAPIFKEKINADKFLKLHSHYIVYCLEREKFYINFGGIREVIIQK